MSETRQLREPSDSESEDATDKNPLVEFILFLMRPQFEDYVALAHNQAGFDGTLLLRGLLDLGIRVDVIFKGRPVMQMKIKSHRLVMIDSARFLQSSLRNLATSFHLNVKKSFYPDSLNTAENYGKVFFPLCLPRKFINRST